MGMRDRFDAGMRLMDRVRPKAKSRASTRKIHR